MDKTDWPDWLLNADTVGAVVEIVDWRVIWLDGTWWGGAWMDGTWKGGPWERGARIDARAHDRCD